MARKNISARTLVEANDKAEVYNSFVNQYASLPPTTLNEIQILTLAGAITGGTFKLSVHGLTTANITWSAVNATLISNINSALNTTFGAGKIVASAKSLIAGVGTISLTFSGGDYAHVAHPVMTITAMALTGIGAKATAYISVYPVPTKDNLINYAMNQALKQAGKGSL